MDSDEHSVEEVYKKADKELGTVQARVIALREMGALDVNLSDEGTQWVIRFRMP